MPKFNQEEFDNIIKHQKKMFGIAVESAEQRGEQAVWDYRLPNQKRNPTIGHQYDMWLKNNSKAPIFDIDYIPIPWQYQYDMEMYIFLNYEELRKKALYTDTIHEEFYTNNGPTGLTRQEHLLNAISIRWPVTIKHTQEHSGLLVRNPWLEDSVQGIADYDNNVYFGGGGQGKTYAALAFECMLFDHFIHTKSGAQCTYSTVSEDKLKNSTWAYVNKLYPLSPQRRPFSLYAGLGRKGADYTFARVDPYTNKRIDFGGKFVGVLLPKGIKDSRVIDKLTGVHDPIARVYLLDEAQSTDGAPLDAYNNMFLHCKYGWFFMSGNFDNDNDLLGINVEPNIGWDNVNEETHTWEGTLKSPKESLNKVCNVIHFNNELSPAMVDIYAGGQGVTRWPFLPNLQKKKKLYADFEKAKTTIAYKRFWIGFRYEKQELSEAEYVLTPNLLLESKCNDRARYSEEPVILGSFDFAPTYSDRNLFTLANIGLSLDDGLPMVEGNKIIEFEKSSSHIEAYKETAAQVKEKMNLNNVQSGNIILDWSSKGPLVSMLNDIGIISHFMLFHGGLPKKEYISPYTKEKEDLIELESIKSMINGLEKEETIYAHQKVKNQQTLGAYVMRQWIEAGRVKNFGPQLFTNIKNKGWDKEMMRRKFIKDKQTELINLDDKDIFIKQYHFSTDIFDTWIMMFYMIHVKFGIRHNIPSLGTLKRKSMKPRLSSFQKLLTLQTGRF